MRLAALCACCVGIMALAPAVASAADAPLRVLIIASETHELLELAAKEVRRYAYATTATFPTIVHSRDGILAEGAAAASTVVLSTARDAQQLMGSSEEGEEGDRLRAVSASVLVGGPDAHACERLNSGATLLLGASPLSVLYAAYEYAATDLGVYFAIDGDRIPRRSARAALPSIARPSASSQPRFGSRGAVP
jgi:hypothetical protein